MKKIIYIILLMSVPVFAGYNPTWVKVSMPTEKVCHGYDTDFFVYANFQNLPGDSTVVTFKLAGMTKTDSVANLKENPETTEKILASFDISEVEIGIYYAEASIGTAKLVTLKKDRKLTIFKVVIQPFDHVGAYDILAPVADKPKGLSNIRKVWVDILPEEAEVSVAFFSSNALIGKARCLDNGGGGITGTALTKSGFIEIEGYEASDVDDNVKLIAWNQDNNLEICAEEKFTVIDCTKPFTLAHVDFVFWSGEPEYKDPEGNVDALKNVGGALDKEVTKLTNDANGNLELVIPTAKDIFWQPRLWCHVYDLQTPEDQAYYKKSNYEIGFVQNLLSADIVYTYLDSDGNITTKKLVKFPKPLKDGSGEDALFTEKLVLQGGGNIMPVPHGRFADAASEPLILDFGDKPVMKASRYLYDNENFTDMSIKESYLYSAKIVLNFRTWIVVRHQPSKCTRKLKHFDWKADWHVLFQNNPPGVNEIPTIVKEVMEILNVGDGDITFVEDGPLVNDQFGANVEYTKE